MKALQTVAAAAGVLLVLLVALGFSQTTLGAAKSGLVASVAIQDDSFASTVTPTPQAGFRIYLPLVMKGWLTWSPNIPTPTATPTLTPTPTPSATPTNTPMPTSTPIPTTLPAELKIAKLICEGADERVTITNSGGQAQVMTDWRIHSVVGPQWYDFPYGYTLAAGATVYIHSGPEAINNPPSDLLWMYRYIWNDDGDEAVLYDSAGQAVYNLCCPAGCRP